MLMILTNLKSLLIVITGFTCLLLGVVLVILPGPAIIFLPLGLALLSTRFNWAKVWLKRCQRWMKKSALAMDKIISHRRYK
jgi:uncharacterized membrane protein YbaN (DUF454 family)